MPFSAAERRQEYQDGYQHGYRLPSTADPNKALAKVRREHAADSPFMRGFRAGLSNRQGEAVAKRKAAWYQKNRERIYAAQKAQRREKAKRVSLAVLQRALQVKAQDS